MPTPSQTGTRLVVLVAIGAAFMSSLDLFVVNVAFDDIGGSLGVTRPGGPTAGDLNWVLNAYAVTFAALLVPFGRLADRYGRKHIFLGGLLVFTLASVACALSGSVWVLVGFRVLQAAGAAAMTPTSLGILLAALPAERRMGGVRLWAATGAIAAAIGPSVGGMLTQFGWQWVFLINVLVGAVLLVLAVREVHEVRPNDEAGVPDLLGAALFAGSVGMLALGLVVGDGVGLIAMDAFTTCFVVASAVLVASSVTAFGMAARVRLGQRRQSGEDRGSVSARASNGRPAGTAQPVPVPENVQPEPRPAAKDRQRPHG